MAKIQILEKHTIDKIAAGEVVENPASVVKELVENSIDAKASSITIELRSGGNEFIRITDNGYGIPSEDLQLAFCRHATSKLTQAQDLYHIKSLGFRGEALSSIAAVSKVELITRYEKEITGVLYKIHGGKEISLEKIGTPIGTTIIIRDLFYNTPVRKKFLKAPSTEKLTCIHLVENLAISHPEISIKLICDGKIQLHTSGNNKLKDVLYTIYGNDLIKELIPLAVDNYQYRVEGYISKASYIKKSRQYQRLFINGRYIQDNKLRNCIEEAYKEHMMHHNFPVYILNILMEPELVDVNVHPAKREVRFVEEEILGRILYEEVKKALGSQEAIPYVYKKQIKDCQVLQETLPTIYPKSKEGGEDNHLAKVRMEESAIKKAFDRVEPFESKRQHELTISMEEEEKMLRPLEKVSQKKIWDEEKFLEEHKKRDYIFIGQLFSTYWLIQYEKNLYIIDQHAAHEKVLYERLAKAMGKSKIDSQQVLPPHHFTLSIEEAMILESYKTIFEEMGFLLKKISDREYDLVGVPIYLFGLDVINGFYEILESLVNHKESLVEHDIKDRIATTACKAAIKGNQKISVVEAKALIDDLMGLDNPYNCPHGRPTIIKISEYEIEKMFKRII